MPLPAHTQQKSDNPPLPVKTKNREGEGRTAACKTYTTFIQKMFDYSLIPPLQIWI